MNVLCPAGDRKGGNDADPADEERRVRKTLGADWPYARLRDDLRLLYKTESDFWRAVDRAINWRRVSGPALRYVSPLIVEEYLDIIAFCLRDLAEVS